MTTTYQVATTAKTQRYGHLELGFATQSTPVRGARITTNPDLKEPVPIGSDWRSLGTVFCDRDDPILMVKDHSPQRDLLAAPARYELLATIQYPIIGDAWKVWRPVPPSSDYVALGVYVTGPDVTPSTDAVACVKKEHSGRVYARRAELSPPVFPIFYNGYRYNVVPLYPHGDTEEHLILPTGRLSFSAQTDPVYTDTTWVLDLPAVVEKLSGPDTPDLENYNPPPEMTIITDRVVTVPFYLITDTARPAMWKAENSPFYKILRKRQFSLVRHVDFRGSGGGQISEAIQQGVSKEKSEEFSIKTGVTVGVTVGVQAVGKIFGASASTTVSTSIETGYSRRYGVTTMESKTVQVSYTVPAGHAGALWSESHELIPIRGDDTLVTDANLKFNSGSYIGRTYPYSDQAPPQVVDLNAATTGNGHPATNIWDLTEVTVIPADGE